MIINHPKNPHPIYKIFNQLAYKINNINVINYVIDYVIYKPKTNEELKEKCRELYVDKYNLINFRRGYGFLIYDSYNNIFTLKTSCNYKLFSVIKKYGLIGRWNTTNITNMEKLFYFDYNKNNVNHFTGKI